MSFTLLRIQGLSPWFAPLGLAAGLVLGGTANEALQESLAPIAVPLILVGVLATSLQQPVAGAFRTSLLALPCTPGHLWTAHRLAWLLNVAGLLLGLTLGVALRGVDPWAWLPATLLLASALTVHLLMEGSQELRTPKAGDQGKADQHQEEARDQSRTASLAAGAGLAMAWHYLGPWVLWAALPVALVALVRLQPRPLELAPPAWLRGRQPQVRIRPHLKAAPKAYVSPPKVARTLPDPEPKGEELHAPSVVGATVDTAVEGRTQSWFRALLASPVLPVLPLLLLEQGPLLALLALTPLAITMRQVEGSLAHLSALPLDERQLFDTRVARPLAGSLVILTLWTLWIGSSVGAVGLQLMLLIPALWLGVAGWIESRRPNPTRQALISRGLRALWGVGLVTPWLALALTLLEDYLPYELAPPWLWQGRPEDLGKVGVLLLGLAPVLAIAAWRDLRSRFQGLPLRPA